MISVITLTYKRKHLLEEAIQSFLMQDIDGCEMIVINDCKETEYRYENQKNVRILNISERFPSVFDKLMYGFSVSKNDYLYRLDDDDLLYQNSLEEAIKEIEENKGYDIYRSKKHHYFLNNQYQGRNGNVNNGNIYTKNYIQSIKENPPKQFGEDYWMTFANNAKIYEYDYDTMIYRWGMQTYHISGLGDISQEKMYNLVDNHKLDTIGVYKLNPHFDKNYYKEINDANK